VAVSVEDRDDDWWEALVELSVRGYVEDELDGPMPDVECDDLGVWCGRCEIVSSRCCCTRCLGGPKEVEV